MSNGIIVKEDQEYPRPRFDFSSGRVTMEEERKPPRFDFTTGGYLPISEEERTGGVRFLKGVGKGIVHPVRAFLPKEGDTEEDLGVAGFVGELVGAGLTFVPLYKGASLALSGVGLLRNVNVLGASVRYLTPLGRTALGVRGAPAATGALAFAGFETFGGETVGEAPKRFVRGAAEGLAFEAAFAGVATAWRATRPKWKPTGVPIEVTPPAPPDVPVHATALKLENFLRPSLSDSDDVVR